MVVAVASNDAWTADRGFPIAPCTRRAGVHQPSVSCTRLRRSHVASQRSAQQKIQRIAAPPGWAVEAFGSSNYTDLTLVQAQRTNAGDMQSPRKAIVAGSKGARAGAISWRWLMPPLLMVMACALQGCANPPAPSPTPNPHPTQTKKLKISVEKGAEVNRVEVESDWVVGNLGCAPVIWPAGNTRVKQVEVSDHVQQVDDSYVATIVLDSFLPDKCHWLNAGPTIRFYHNAYLVSVLGVNDDVSSGKRTLEMTCLTRPFVDVGTCGIRDEESFYKSEDKHAFNVTVELIK